MDMYSYPWGTRLCPGVHAAGPDPGTPCQGYPLGDATLTVDPAGTVSNRPIASPTGSGSHGAGALQGPAIGGLGRGGTAQRLVGLGSGIGTLSEGRGLGEAETLERRELTILPGEGWDEEAPEEVAAELDELPWATASSKGESLSEGGTGGGAGFLDDMPRERRGRVGRDGGVSVCEAYIELDDGGRLCEAILIQTHAISDLSKQELPLEGGCAVLIRSGWGKIFKGPLARWGLWKCRW